MQEAPEVSSDKIYLVDDMAGYLSEVEDCFYSAIPEKLFERDEIDEIKANILGIHDCIIDALNRWDRNGEAS